MPTTDVHNNVYYGRQPTPTLAGSRCTLQREEQGVYIQERREAMYIHGAESEEGFMMSDFSENKRGPSHSEKPAATSEKKPVAGFGGIPEKILS